jgi:hypothetical protein
MGQRKDEHFILQKIGEISTTYTLSLSLLFLALSGFMSLRK